MNRISLIDLAKNEPLEPLLEKEVQVRAYQLYEQRGKGHGFARFAYEALAEFSGGNWNTRSLLDMPAQASQFTLNPLFTFTCDSTGNCPNGKVATSLIQSADGNFYGTTAFGGSGSQAAGTVFKLTPSEELITLFTFTTDQNGGCSRSVHRALTFRRFRFSMGSQMALTAFL